MKTVKIVSIVTQLQPSQLPRQSERLNLSAIVDLSPVWIDCSG